MIVFPNFTSFKLLSSIYYYLSIVKTRDDQVLSVDLGFKKQTTTTVVRI